MRIAEQLHLDVPRAADQLLEVDLVVAERGLGLAACRGDELGERGFVLDDAHATPAAAPTGLEHQPRGGRGIGRQRTGRGHHGDARRDREGARRHLVAKGAHRLRRRTDEDQACRRAGLGEVGVLGEEAVARVDRVDMRLVGDADDVGDVEVGLDRTLAVAHEIALVGLGPVQREAILPGVDRDRADAELVRGAHHADRDLAAVGDQEALDTASGGMEVRHGRFRWLAPTADRSRNCSAS